jgi:hypothetical protein
MNLLNVHNFVDCAIQTFIRRSRDVTGADFVSPAIPALRISRRMSGH